MRVDVFTQGLEPSFIFSPHVVRNHDVVMLGKFATERLAEKQRFKVETNYRLFLFKKGVTIKDMSWEDREDREERCNLANFTKISWIKHHEDGSADSGMSYFYVKPVGPESRGDAFDELHYVNPVYKYVEEE